MTTRQMLWFLLAAASVVFAGTGVWADEKDISAGDAIVGKWWFPEMNGQLEIRREKGQYVGTVIAYDEPNAIDDANPDPKLARRKFVGIEMLSGFKYNPNKKHWAGGAVYDGKSGKTYRGTLWFKNDDTSKLIARGYVRVSLVGRTETFIRATK